ncbi:mediator of RNA polymerase II transcription subunit 15a-like isoform X2 [Corylus avellana]|uniref:mediator of RNA polymerase II transcription subunit 15a-like isoform X2 n=1 Tax=Corylus avellana TaxID=13451 RepID=UPI00286A74A8|nr:mediator of RNA polymerase II transcription subunit 15a-like isoform X2 [Corylus avellana]
MDTNNWRSNPSQAPVGGGAEGGGEPTIDTGDWRTELPPDSRQSIVNKRMDTLKRHLPVSGQEGLHELKKIAIRFEEKIYTAATSQSLVQSHIQQQQPQQNLLQPKQLQSSQQSVMQTSSVMQLSPLSGLQQNQQPSIQQATLSMLEQDSQSVLRQRQQPQQAAIIHQQQTPMQQQLIGQQSNATNMQQNQLIAQQKSVGYMQQQQQRLLGQQSNLQNMQQQKQQLIAQQNNLSDMHQQQLGSQTNVSGLQQEQQQLLGTRSVNSSMQTTQHRVHMLKQPKVPVLHQPQQSASNLLPTQGQPSQSQPQPPEQHQQQLMSQIQLQQQSNSLQRDMHQRLQALGQASGSLLQPQNVIDQQKQLYQRILPETSSKSLDSTAQIGHANGDGWQEEVYQKHDSLPQQLKSDKLEKLKMFRTMLERIITFLQVSKNNILPNIKEKLGSYEKQILNFINAHRPRKPVSSLPQPQSQSTQKQSHENQMNLQGSAAALDSTSQTGRANGGDWQEEVYQEIKAVKEMLESFEKQILDFGDTNRPRNRVSSLQQGQLPPPHVHPMQQPHENKMNPQLHSINLQGSVAALDSTAQTGRANGGDWQEEVYQKIKAMKELYLPEINEMYQKIATKLQQHDSLPQQPKSDQIEKLKIFRTMLERIITFLQVSKNNILPNFKDKLGSYEKQILNFINTNRPRKPASSLPQGQLPLPHMHSMQQPQSQITQKQSQKNQMNPQNSAGAQ